MKYLILALLLASGSVQADARQVDDYQWEGVSRVVAIGDLHGDYENYLAALQAAGVADRKGKWSGGDAHLVQTGDIPDRGPDTLKIFEHLDKLARQAERKGGRVHSLIGNHEAMNVYGDLRYVSKGEYEAFVSRNSETLRDRYFELYLQALERQDPETFANLPENFRETWNVEHPLGWVEHRQAWDPAWNPEAELARRVLDSKVAVRINDTLFVHGGISGFYCRNSLASLTEGVRSGLVNFDPQTPGIVEDEFGPLWYRGLSGVAPEAPPETVDAILAHHGVKRIAVGHTPTSGVIWPQYGGKVVMIDTGISDAYGGHLGWLELTPEGVYAGYPGGRLPLPTGEQSRVEYLENVIALVPGNPYLERRLAQLKQPQEPAVAEAESGDSGQEAGEDAPGTQEAPQQAPVEIPICGISQ